MSSIRAHQVGFAFAHGTSVFDRATFHLGRGWTGLVGANGSGKTTLLRLIAGELVPTAGHLQLEPERARFSLCPQRVDDLAPEIEAFAAASGASSRRVLGQLRLVPEALSRWNSLSPGERKRWQVGAALAAEPDVLLLDEPTNHLDSEARGWLLAALGRFRGVGVVVSHDREVLDTLTRHTLRVHAGRVALWAGGYSSARSAWEEEARAQQQVRAQAVERHRKAKRHLAEMRQAHTAADSQLSAKKRMRSRYDSDARSLGARFRVEVAEKSLGRRVAVARRDAERLTAEIPAFELDRTVGRSVFVGYEPPPKRSLISLDLEELRAGPKRLLGPTRLQVDRTSRIWITGRNGAGKTTLLRALLTAARIAEERLLHLPQELTEEQCARALEQVRALAPLERGRTLSLVAALGVDPDHLLASAQPSPGEARKLTIASGLGRHVWALVLDEPTHHLDLPSIERLEEALVSFPGALVLVSHDPAFARRYTTERWHLENEAVTVSSV